MAVLFLFFGHPRLNNATADNVFSNGSPIHPATEWGDAATIQRSAASGRARVIGSAGRCCPPPPPPTPPLPPRRCLRLRKPRMWSSSKRIPSRCCPIASGWRWRRRPRQGLTLVHFSAQIGRFVCDRGCAHGLRGPCQGGVRVCVGCVGYSLVSDTAQVELRSGRV